VALVKPKKIALIRIPANLISRKDQAPIKQTTTTITSAQEADSDPELQQRGESIQQLTSVC
jgi:hypothetical protein